MFDTLEQINSLWGEEPEEQTQEEVVESEETVEDESTEPKEPTFETVEAAKEYYTKQIQEKDAYYTSNEFVEKLKTDYARTLLSAEQEAEEMKTLHRAFKNEPELMLKLYYPEYLGRVGIGVQFSAEEKQKVIVNTLSKEFGSDFQSKFNQTEYNNPDTLSGKMYARQQEILNNLKAQEQAAQQAWKDSQPDPAKLEKIIAQQRQEFFPTLKDDQFNNLVSELQDFRPNLLDLDFAKNREAYLKAAYEHGKAEGRKAIGKEISNAGKKLEVNNNRPAANSQDNPYRNFGAIIPRY